MPIVLALDAATTATAYLLVLGIVGPAVNPTLLQPRAHLVWLVLLSITGNLIFRVYNCSWRFISLTDVPVLCAFVTFVTLFFGFALMLSHTYAAHTILICSFFSMLLSVLIVLPRMLVRRYFHCHKATVDAGAPVLIAGDGWPTENFVRTSRLTSSARAYRPVGILTRPPAQIGRTIQGVPVLGSYDQFEQVARDLRRRGLPLGHLALSSSREEIDGTACRRLCLTAQQLGIPVARLPRPADLEHATARPSDLIPLAISDLLGRKEVCLDPSPVRRLVGHRRVLITGAGGTIGFELARQIARLQPVELVLLDHSEYNLYRAELEIKEIGFGRSLKCLICDVRDPERVGGIFAEHRPQIVFHAAAMKHVPIVESNLSEGVLTNALGTSNVADAAFACHAQIMTLISTDKAVSPQNIMGATKRISERYCQSLHAFSCGRTRFIAVRFGNVAASSGSVIPLFQRQIALGGPVTVTHPDVRRFFMSCEEAVGLVLHATALSLAPRDSAAGGHIYVLDMGEPIRIAELAAQMIRLAGLAPGEDVKIEFVGLRPGEKLEESLFHITELVEPTAVPQIARIVSGHPIPYPMLRSLLDDLITVARRHDERAVRQILATTLALCDGPQSSAQHAYLGSSRAAAGGATSKDANASYHDSRQGPASESWDAVARETA